MKIKVKNKPNWKQFWGMLLFGLLFLIVTYVFQRINFNVFNVPLWVGWVAFIGFFIAGLSYLFEIK